MSIKDKVYAFIKENESSIQQYGVARLGLFGSTVRGDETARSDIDVIVEFLPGQKNYDNYIDLCFFLEDQLGRKIDLLTAESLSPLIKPFVQAEVEYVQIAS
ncbi:MAG: nucleotidyltransferase family protein [Verrucomicrobia bacterium]|nr:nucleotidyltransferase family protein [Verrucomicrobiota bacterium]